MTTKSEYELLAEDITAIFPLIVEEKKEIVLHKGVGNRTIVSHGKEVGSMIGHIDHVPHVSFVDLSNDPSKDRFHAYASVNRRDTHGISRPVTKRLGDFSSPDDALSAIKKFHKLA